jgi:hypothetical protein
MRNALLPLILSTLTVAFSYWLIVTSLSFQQCISIADHSSSSETIWVYRTCAGEYFRSQGQEVLILHDCACSINNLSLVLHSGCRQSGQAGGSTHPGRRTCVCETVSCSPGYQVGASGPFGLRKGPGHKVMREQNALDFDDAGGGSDVMHHLIPVVG